ncbi:MAG TPA: DUF2459 domain-containing protein [Burkholderiales bacterium]|nr:DUF2459 domain-containing protein [Burkholderiales bacterium]
MRSVFVVGHGYHTGLIVRARDLPDAWPARGDFPSAEFLELGWGARDYYPVDDPGLWRAFRALFTPSASTVNVVPREGLLTRSLRDSEIVELRVPDERFAHTLEYLRQSYTLDRDGRAAIVPAGARQEGRFYESPLVFHALSNCNMWVARALESAGLPVDPRMAMTAGLLLRQVRALSPDAGYAQASLPLPDR